MFQQAMVAFPYSASRGWLPSQTPTRLRIVPTVKRLAYLCSPLSMRSDRLAPYSPFPRLILYYRATYYWHLTAIACTLLPYPLSTRASYLEYVLSWYSTASLTVLVGWPDVISDATKVF